KGIYYLHKGSTGMQHIPIRYKGEELSVTKFFIDEQGDMYLGTKYSLFRYHADDQSKPYCLAQSRTR
ncbi:MAG TPA: hypothetical protein PLR30_14680, partial [Saprospiraceae bacterium]|nr:hypothetical protein [Saprospiraceae bacterium]